MPVSVAHDLASWLALGQRQDPESCRWPLVPHLYLEHRVYKTRKHYFYRFRYFRNLHIGAVARANGLSRAEQVPKQPFEIRIFLRAASPSSG